jgi:hypothetical protein
MSGPNYGLDKGYNLSNSGAAQSIYRFMKFGATENTVLQTAAITDKALGVCQQRVEAVDSATGNVQVDVRIFGISKVEVGAANSGVIALGSFVAPDAVGCAQVAAATQFAMGVALQASTAAGQWIDVLIIPFIRSTAMGTA